MTGLPAWQRYECKYLVPESVAAALRRRLLPFLQPDEHAAGSPDHTYPVSTLYLDGSELQLYRETVEGKKQRYKLRIRAYTDDPTVPLFAEIKRRHDGIVHKQRCPVPRAALATITAGTPPDLSAMRPAQASALLEFCRLVQLRRALPTVVVRYDRQAYVGAVEPESRVTFDRALRTLRTDQPVLPVQDARFQPVAVRGVVLELKFTNRCPNWMLQAVQHFGLRRISFSKYCRSVDRIGATGLEAAH